LFSIGRIFLPESGIPPQSADRDELARKKNETLSASESGALISSNSRPLARKAGEISVENKN
jgi:hypothetical protein